MAKQNTKDRRAIIAGLGAVAATSALGARSVRVQEASSNAFMPTLHPQDDWMSAIPGSQHRIVIDTTSAEGVPNAIRFASNLLSGHKDAWGVEESDVAVLVCLRHGATAWAYADPIWSKYGKTLDPRAATPPVTNDYNSGPEPQLAGLAKRGVHFMVCGRASRGIAGRIAGPSGDVDGVLEEMRANLIPSARIVPVGVVAVVHAQERHFSLISVG